MQLSLDLAWAWACCLNPDRAFHSFNYDVFVSGELFAIQRDQLKYVSDGNGESSALDDLAADPAEKTNLLNLKVSEGGPSTLINEGEALARELETWISSFPKGIETAIPAETRRQLEVLGYGE